MKYWIFGGNGFVGRYLANALAELKEQVVVCDLHDTLHNDIQPSCEYLRVDIRDAEVLANLPIAKEDVVINMAEISDSQRAQIEDIVKRKAEVPGENIIITPVSGE